MVYSSFCNTESQFFTPNHTTYCNSTLSTGLNTYYGSIYTVGRSQYGSHSTIMYIRVGGVSGPEIMTSTTCTLTKTSLFTSILYIHFWSHLAFVIATVLSATISTVCVHHYYSIAPPCVLRHTVHQCYMVQEPGMW